MEAEPTTATPEEFCETLESQQAGYERLEELAREQGELIQAGRTEELLTVLQRRQLYVERIAEQEGLLQAVKRNWPQSAAAWPEPVRRRAEGRLAAIKHLLEQITTCDRRDMQALQAQNSDVSRQLHRSVADERTTRRVNQRYATSAYAARPSRMDLTR